MGALRNMIPVLIALFPAALATAAGLAETGSSYSLAVIPSAPPEATRVQWTPFLERLSRETGLRFQLKLYEKIEPFEKDLENGIPDLIFAHPLQTVEAKRDQGYEPLVRGSRTIAGVVFVRMDSPVKTAKNLEGKVIAMVGSRNVCAILVRQELENGEGVRFRFHFAGSAPKVIQSVLQGEADAGASLDSALAAEPSETRDRIRIVVTTPPTAPHPLSAHPRVPRNDREHLTAGILRMGADAQGQGLLKAVRLATPVRADYAQDYRPLEKVDSSIFSAEE